jgi:hypothetical protein
MTASAPSAAPVYTIEVGTPGAFTNDATVDISSTLNAEIAAAPAGDRIEIDFNPGNYGASSSILLPSNTTVKGNNATIGVAGSSFSGIGLFASADAYFQNGQLLVKTANGSTVSTPFDPNTTTFYFPQGTITETNISIQGMTFNETGSTTGPNLINYNGGFGSLLVNVQNVNIQNNVFIGGTDGEALVDATNAIVANNVAIGVQNSAYDNWNGPTNITIEDNATYMSAAQNTGWSILINSTPTNNPNNPGNAVNDAIIGNILSSAVVSGNQIVATPLFSYGQTTMTGLTISDNIDSLLGLPGGGVYSVDNTNSTIDDNLVAGSATTGFSPEFLAASSGSTAPQLESNVSLSGNLAVGSATPSSDDTVIGGKAIRSTDNLGIDATQSINSVGETSVSGVTISSPSNLIITQGSSIALTGTSVEGFSGGSQVTLVLSTQFGTLESAGSLTLSPGQALTLTGTESILDQELAALTYIGNGLGWDDAVEIQVTSPLDSFTQYIPILYSPNETASVGSSETFNSSIINTAAVDAITDPGFNPANGPNLSGQIIVASLDNETITMGGTSSVAFLESDNDTLIGGSMQQYIVGGSGNDAVLLTGGGDATVAGGPGSLKVDAALGNDLIESGASSASIVGGAGAISVIGGIGTSQFTGGQGSVYISTMPLGGGDFSANLGTGNSTVLFLSGNDQATTRVGTTNEFALGNGQSTITSQGNDEIYAGQGNATVNAREGGIDTVVLGWGTLDVAAGILSASVSSSNPMYFGVGSVFAAAGAVTSVLPNGTQVELASSDSSLLAFGGTQGYVVSISGAATINNSQPNETIYGAQGQLTYSSGNTDTATVVAGSKSEILSFAQGYHTVQSSMGAVTINAAIAAGLTASLGGGGGAVTASGSGSNNISTSASANNQISIPGTANSTIQSNGNDTISTNGSAVIQAGISSNDSINMVSGSLNFTNGVSGKISASNADISLNSGVATISAVSFSQTSVAFANGANNQLLFINSSFLKQTVSSGNLGSVTAYGGYGGGFYAGGLSGNNSLIGGYGAVTLQGGGNGDVLQSSAAQGTNFLLAGNGAETLLGGSSSNSNIFSLSMPGSDVVSSDGSGSQKFIVNQTSGLSGTLTGSQAFGATNQFDFFSTNAAVGDTFVINNFESKNSGIYLYDTAGGGLGAPSVTGIASINAGSQLSSVINLTNNTKITLIGVDPSQLVTVVLSNGSSYIS